MSQIDVIRDLQERLRRMERAQRGARETALSAASWFLARPLEWGTLLEWLGDDGSGAATLALTVAANVLGEEGIFVVVDSRGEFYPPAAAALGIPLQRSVIVRPGSGNDALWALEQSLRSGAAAVVLGWVGPAHDAALRRLQLAAETGGSLGFLLRPIPCRAEPSWAEMRLLVDAAKKAEDVPPEPAAQARDTVLHEPAAQARDSNPCLRCGLVKDDPCLRRGLVEDVLRWRIEVLHRRGGGSGEVVQVELSNEADHVHLAARLARAALPADRAGP